VSWLQSINHCHHENQSSSRFSLSQALIEIRCAADKRNAVLVALNDAEWGKLSSRAIAEMCGVSNVTVMSIRNESKGSTAKVEQSNAPPTRQLATVATWASQWSRSLLAVPPVAKPTSEIPRYSVGDIANCQPSPYPCLCWRFRQHALIQIRCDAARLLSSRRCTCTSPSRTW
jgi:hypothetical protein